MKKNLLAAVLVFGFGSTALAAATPSSDSITLKGKAAEMVAIKITNATKEHDFTAQLATATTDTAVESAAFGFELRSNVDYTLSASVVDNSTDKATNEVDEADISYTFTDLSGSGSKLKGTTTDPVSNVTSRTDTVVTKTGTLADLGTAGKAIVSGGRISNKGGFNDAANAISGSVKFALAPQFFAPTTEFNYAVTLTIASQ